MYTNIVISYKPCNTKKIVLYGLLIEFKLKTLRHKVSWYKIFKWCDLIIVKFMHVYVRNVFRNDDILILKYKKR